MHSAVLVTLGATLGGLVTDLMAPRRRNPSLRRWLIETLAREINQGTSGPLRLVERDDGLYVVGYGLSHRVDSEEEAEELVGILLGEVRDTLGGSGLDAPAEIPMTEAPGTIEVNLSEGPDAQFTEVPDPPSAQDIQWEEWPETVEAACDRTADAPQEMEIEPGRDEKLAPVQVETATLLVPALTNGDAAPRTVGVEDVDEVLSGIVSRMRACCPAA